MMPTYRSTKGDDEMILVHWPWQLSHRNAISTQLGIFLNKPNSGRPSVTTKRQDRRIRVQHLRAQCRTVRLTVTETPDRKNPRLVRKNS